MQTTAVINAAINVIKECGYNIAFCIMIPLVAKKELKFVKDVVATADKLIAEAGVDMKYEVGTMIEIPRRPDGRRDRQGSRILLLRHQ